jgi:hypothetical protein
MYSLHTCFKTILRAAEARKEQNVTQVLIKNTIPPCKMCRAWWRRIDRSLGIHATITTEGIEWKSADPSIPEHTCAAGPLGYAEAELDRSPVPIPEPLRSAYQSAGRSSLNQLHNRLRPPGDLEQDDDGFVTFAEENQYVVTWGFNTADTGENIEVYQKECDGPWIPEGQTMGDFLMAFAYWNAAHGAANYSGVGEVSATTRSLLKECSLVWQAPDFDMHMAGEAHVIVDDGEFGNIYCFGPSVEIIASAAEALQVKWLDLG